MMKKTKVIFALMALAASGMALALDRICYTDHMKFFPDAEGRAAPAGNQQNMKADAALGRAYEFEVQLPDGAIWLGRVDQSTMASAKISAPNALCASGQKPCIADPSKPAEVYIHLAGHGSAICRSGIEIGERQIRIERHVARGKDGEILADLHLPVTDSISHCLNMGSDGSISGRWDQNIPNQTENESSGVHFKPYLIKASRIDPTLTATATAKP